MLRNETICDCNVIHEAKVEKVKEQMFEEDIFDKSSKFLKALSDKTRLKILHILDKEELCVCDIANVLNMTKSSISHQLGTLKEQKIIKSRKEGKEVYYSLDDDQVKEVLEMSIEHIKHKERSNA